MAAYPLYLSSGVGPGGTQWHKAFPKFQGRKGQVYGLGNKVWAPVSPFIKCSKQLLQRDVESLCELTSGGFGTGLALLTGNKTPRSVAIVMVDPVRVQDRQERR